jgi:hypothetical protein
VSDLLWDEVRTFFDADLMGQLPDVQIRGTSVDDWQKLLDLVQSSGWVWEYLLGQEPAPLPSATEVFTRPADGEYQELHVYPAAGVLMIFRPLSADQIDFDMDVRELQGQEGVDLLCEFLTVLGHRLDKSVLMCAEGDYENPVLGFEVAADRVVLLAAPRP